MNQPRTFGPYLLLRRLAVGGMAEIYVASTHGLGGFEKLAAIKLVHPHLAEDPQFVRMLIEEAKISVLLTHANIAQVFDLGCIDATYYIAMEFVDGLDVQGLQTAAQHLAQPLPIAVCAYTVAEMLNGLDYAHRKRDASGRPLNIVHRDISPQNVVLSMAGDVKLVDFGIAKSSRQNGEGTEAGVIKGKYYYMSPEQAWGDPTDRRSDVFATGILLHEMLTGHMLYTGKSVPELIGKVRSAQVIAPTALRGDIPEALSEIVMRALQREPGGRYQSAIDMGEALRDFLYATYPAFNASKLGEFVTQVVEAERVRALAASKADDTRKLRALTREDFVRNENSVLFNLRDAGVLQTRQNAPPKAKKPGPPPVPPRNSLPPLPGRPGRPPVRPAVPGRIGASLPPPPPSFPRAILSPAGADARRGRISTWPHDSGSQVDTSELLANMAPGASSSQFGPNDDMEPTGRYMPAHVAGMASRARGQLAQPSTPSILPSLEPPPSHGEVPADVAATGANKPALMPPRGEDSSLGPIPPSPLVPDFDARRRAVPWLAIVIGVICAVLGILGFQLWPREVPPPHLEIVSAPSGARVSVDGRAQPGSTPLRLVGLEKGRRYALEVALIGYYPWTSTHLATGSSVQQIAVLRPITKTLRVSSVPPGASIYLADTLVGRTPLAIPSLAVSQPARLRIELPGYAVERRELTLTPDDEEAQLSIKLTPRR